MQPQSVTAQVQPSRVQIQPAALELLSRHSAGLLATARRYSATPEDAEDAYQRGVEILLTKAPTTTEEHLLPWLKTVVKHECFAVRKSSGRMVLSDDAGALEVDGRGWTDERAERYEQLRIGAEAMSALKPQEIRCLLLKAEGLSYQEICAATGFSYTKVNRCITEGRKAFMARVAGIESGAECERLAPLISKIADGEASPEEMRKVRPHLKGCLACKATLREYRATPSRIAGLVPPVVALAGDGQGVGLLGRLFERASALSDRISGLGDAAGAKVSAVAASAALVAGGGAAGVTALHHDAPPVPAPAYAAAHASSVGADASAPATLAPSAPGPVMPTVSAAPDPQPAVAQALADASPATTRPTGEGDERAAESAPEFDPGTAGGSTPSTTQPNEFATEPSASAPTADPAAPAPDGSGEFGP